MKKYTIGILSTLILALAHNSKVVVFIFGSFMVHKSTAQNPAYLNWAINTDTVSLEAQLIYHPLRNVIKIKDTTQFHIKLPYVYFNNLALAPTTASALTTLDGSGQLTKSAISSLTLSTSQVNSALGYVPYNSTNPSGYISSYTETDPLFNSKFSTKNTADLTEGSNLYFTASRTRTTVSSGTGIGYSNSTGVITNTNPDQTVVETASTGISISSSYPNFTITNSLPDQTVGISSANLELAVTSSYPNFTMTPYVPTTFTVSRTINSVTFQPSASHMTWVYYSIRINCTATIGSTASGTVNLQYSTNNGSTWIDVGQIENSPSVALAAILSLNDNKVMQISGIIPVAAIVRLTQSTTGTTTITFIKGQETY